MGAGPSSLLVGSKLNDGQWHSIKLSRRDKTVELFVDQTKKNFIISGDHSVLAYDLVHLGKIYDPYITNKTMKNPTRVYQSFIGNIENVKFNEEYLIDKCLLEQNYNCEKNCSYRDSSEKIVAFPITFARSENFVSVRPRLFKRNSITIKFTMKTIVNDGIILYHTSENKNFLAVELMQGSLHLFVSSGGVKQPLTSSPPGLVNDNRWHDITIVLYSTGKFKLDIDGSSTEYVDSRLSCPEIGLLYIGGVKQEIFRNNLLPTSLYSRNGYEGCMASIVIEDKVYDLMALDPQIINRPDKSFKRGCNGPSRSPQSQCQCKNGGTCINRWTGFKCDCSLTFYAGNMCERHILKGNLTDGPACLFGSNLGSSQNKGRPLGGVLVYTWEGTLPSTRGDLLSLTFQTTTKDATLIQVRGESPKLKADYLKLLIENGKLTLKFNVGAKDIILTEPRPVTDGVLHYVVIERKMTNATMRVDDWTIRKTKQGGSQSLSMLMSNVPTDSRNLVTKWLKKRDAQYTVFNSQSSIEVGGILNPAYSIKNDENKKYRIDQPFFGKMSKVYFNNVEPIKLYRQNHSGTFAYGDVQLIGVNSFYPINNTSTQSPYKATARCKSQKCQGLYGTEQMPTTNNISGEPYPPLDNNSTLIAGMSLPLVAGGVVGSASFFIIIIVASVFCYKSKQAKRRRAAKYVYRVGEGEKNHHEMNNKLNGNHFANLPKNGANLQPTLRKSPVGEIEKEYYV